MGPTKNEANSRMGAKLTMAPSQPWGQLIFGAKSTMGQSQP
jgi:hypothetical protein